MFTVATARSVWRKTVAALPATPNPPPPTPPISSVSSSSKVHNCGLRRQNPSFVDRAFIEQALSDEAKMMSMFEDWMEHFGCHYPTQEEKQKRFEIFKKTAQTVYENPPCAFDSLADTSLEELTCGGTWRDYLDFNPFI